MTTPTRVVMGAVAVERARQDGKWGEQDHDDPTWNAILAEEAGEVASAILGLTFRYCDDTASELTASLRNELVQVAAVAVAWVEAIDRRPS